MRPAMKRHISGKLISSQSSSNQTITNSEKLSKWLVQEFKQYPPPEGFCVNNTFDFIERVEKETIQPDEVLISFDVEALFPSIVPPVWKPVWIFWNIGWTDTNETRKRETCTWQRLSFASSRIFAKWIMRHKYGQCSLSVHRQFVYVPPRACTVNKWPSTENMVAIRRRCVRCHKTQRRKANTGPIGHAICYHQVLVWTGRERKIALSRCYDHAKEWKTGIWCLP